MMRSVTTTAGTPGSGRRCVPRSGAAGEAARLGSVLRRDALTVRIAAPTAARSLPGSTREAQVRAELVQPGARPAASLAVVMTGSAPSTSATRRASSLPPPCVRAEHRDRVAQRLVHADHAGIAPSCLSSSGATSRTVAPTARKQTTASHSPKAPAAAPRRLVRRSGGRRARPLEPCRRGPAGRGDATRPITAGPRGRRPGSGRRGGLAAPGPQGAGRAGTPAAGRRRPVAQAGQQVGGRADPVHRGERDHDAGRVRVPTAASSTARSPPPAKTASRAAGPPGPPARGRGRSARGRRAGRRCARIRSHCAESDSTAITWAPNRAHSTATEPEPAPTSQIVRPGAGPSRASTSARTSALVIIESRCSNASSGSAQPSGAPWWPRQPAGRARRLLVQRDEDVGVGEVACGVRRPGRRGVPARCRGVRRRYTVLPAASSSRPRSRAVPGRGQDGGLGSASAAASACLGSRPCAETTRASSQARPSRANASATDETAGMTAGADAARAQRADDAEEARVAGGQHDGAALVGGQGVERLVEVLDLVALRACPGSGRRRGAWAHRPPVRLG